MKKCDVCGNIVHEDEIETCEICGCNMCPDCSINGYCEDCIWINLDDDIIEDDYDPNL